ncbi:MAG: 16S rRNA (guanine(966)-N(2))-methyltransferase RsmD [Clostridia bacterium]|nr:16S rRNA (guanine(966)-N(2))-methyltransferase RsmD [Clostridia bacterium]
MRIISGDAKGRALVAPKGSDTRPTSDKLRGALFNIIGTRVWDASVLDVFGGTGALALEAISRGAQFAAIVDSSYTAMRAIRRNVEAVAGADTKRVICIQKDYQAALPHLADRNFDIVFLDPPYHMQNAYAIACALLRQYGCLSDDAIVIMEYAQEMDIAIPEGFESYDERRYGAARVRFLREIR